MTMDFDAIGKNCNRHKLFNLQSDDPKILYASDGNEVVVITKNGFMRFKLEDRQKILDDIKEVTDYLYSERRLIKTLTPYDHRCSKESKDL